MSKQQACFDFIKLLIEFGGIYSVDGEGYIYDNEDEPVLINVNNKGIPLRIYKPNMVAGDYAILNPLVEPLGVFDERVWFFTSRCAIIGNITKSMIVKLAEQAIKNADSLEYDKLELVQPYLSAFDEKFLGEISKIKPVRLIRLDYNKKTRTAKLMTDVYDEEYRESLGKGFRKRTWSAITGLLETFYGTDDISGTFTYKATNIGFPEADASINLLVMVAEAIYQYAEVIIKDRDLKLHVGELVEHIKHIKDYHDVSAWFSSGNTQKAATEENSIKSIAPWQTKEITGIVPGGRYTPSNTFRAHSFDPSGIVPSVLQPPPQNGPINILPNDGRGIIVPRISGHTGIKLRETLSDPNGPGILKPRLKR